MKRILNMSHALVVGVSKYKLPGFHDLPACARDAAVINDTLQRECFFDAKNIRILKGEVSFATFCSELEVLISAGIDTLVVYFSGHGDLTKENEVYLVFSDGLLAASSIVEYCRRSCQTTWLIFDMCHAGAIPFSAESFGNLSAKAGEGCALFASCAPDAFSYIDSKSPYSAFTNMLVEAMCITRCNQGVRSLPDIERALHCLIEKRNQSTEKRQRPLFLHSSAGSIMFHDPGYIPYRWYAGKLPETELFIVKKVETCFADRKRYSCKVLAKTHLDYKSIIQELPKLIDLLREYETYDTELQQRQWKGKETEVLFIYFAANEDDYLNSLFPFCAIWSNQQQDEKLGRGVWCDESQCWICEQWTSSKLNEMRRLYAEGAVSDSVAIQQAKVVLDMVATSASTVFLAGDRWLGGLISIDKFSEVIEANQKQIEESLEAALQIGYPTKILRQLEDQIIDLAGALRDLPLFFLGNGRIGRTEENLKQCFNITRRRYDNARIKIAEIVDSIAL